MNKTLSVIVIIILIAGGFWFFMRADDTQTPSTKQTPSTAQTTPVTKQPSTSSATQTPSSQTQTNNRVVFNIKGTKFAYDKKELTVTEGDMVTINFESADGFHDWVIDEFNAATKQVDVGVPTSVTFVADKVGVFEYYCSVGNHRAMGMVGKLTVVAKQ
ncbi:MAG: Nitrite reductase [Parcubacteria group bacterium GW2011_GWA2_43_11]|nr:MAG: Nitrite reductase [Parcubacteria group bacterium GW2011_GWC2_42_11]KKS84907.1 MAG: Nitrite reductase [Parcubacteria group bacterium GW2011_GWA2_43_11]